MDYTDLHFIHAISGRLQLFKQKGSDKWNFRCPFCGDSKRFKNKSRGWLYEYNNSVIFKCFNCEESKSLEHFIKDIDNELYNEYRTEKYFSKTKKKTKGELQTPIRKIPVSYMADVLCKLPSIASLDDFNPYKQYVIQRKIPEQFWDKLYYCPEFKKFVNLCIPNKMNEEKDEPRLLIPFFDENKKMFAFAG